MKYIVMLLLVPVAWFTWAFSASKIWLWFIVAEFGVDPLSYRGAIGLSIFSSLFLLGVARESSVKNEESDVLTKVIVAVLTPLIILVFAWIANQVF